jgi:hypothetical protein
VVELVPDRELAGSSQRELAGCSLAQHATEQLTHQHQDATDAPLALL